MGEVVFGLGLGRPRARVGRPDRPGDRATRRQENEEARRPDRQTDEAVARVLDAAADATDREQQCEADGEPAERSPSNEESDNGCAGHRKVVAEQA